jgi:hypothetical protein
VYGVAYGAPDGITYCCGTVGGMTAGVKVCGHVPVGHVGATTGVV